MSQAPHDRLPIEDLAAARRVLSGSVEATAFDERLAAALGRSRPAGAVVYSLAFAPGVAGAIELTGRLDARLGALCQRCLQPFEVEFEAPVRLVFPAPGTRAGDDYAEWESADAGARPTLAGIIEEELLLALPFTPRHPLGECPAAPVSEEEPEEAVQRPFAGLDELVRRGGD